MTGTVIGVEKQKQPAGKDAVIENEVLNMWCAEGLRSVKLTEVQRLRFLNPVMETEFRKACASATSSRARFGRRATGWC